MSGIEDYNIDDASSLEDIEAETTSELEGFWDFDEDNDQNPENPDTTNLEELERRAIILYPTSGIQRPPSAETLREYEELTRAPHTARNHSNQIRRL